MVKNLINNKKTIPKLRSIQIDDPCMYPDLLIGDIAVIKPLASYEGDGIYQTKNGLIRIEAVAGRAKIVGKMVPLRALRKHIIGKVIGFSRRW